MVLIRSNRPLTGQCNLRFAAALIRRIYRDSASLGDSVRSTCFALLLASFLSWTWAIPASAAHMFIRADQWVEVTFSAPGPIQGDALKLRSDAVSGVGGHVTTDLFDGSVLLGSDTRVVGVGAFGFSETIASFRSASSLYRWESPSFADLTPFNDGSIDGRLRISNDRNWDLDLDRVWMSMLYNTNSAGGNVSYPRPTITSISIVPEPSPSLLLLIGVGLLGTGKRIAVIRGRAPSQ